MNPGKQFEKDFENSIPKHCFAQRLNDSKNGAVQDKNICDYLVYDGVILYGIECKSYDSDIIPIHPKHIKDYQIDGLAKMVNKKNCFGAFLLNFRKSKETYFLSANYIKYLRDKKKQKSVSLSNAKEGGTRVKAVCEYGKTRYELTFIREVQTWSCVRYANAE